MPPQNLTLAVTRCLTQIPHRTSHTTCNLRPKTAQRRRGRPNFPAADNPLTNLPVLDANLMAFAKNLEFYRRRAKLIELNIVVARSVVRDDRGAAVQCSPVTGSSSICEYLANLRPAASPSALHTRKKANCLS